ncbi:MAG: ATP-binding cassette domain-containing protein [Phycisphaerales bacterium]
MTTCATTGVRDDLLAIEARLDRGPFRLDVSFSTSARVVGLFGPSGAGKTTLLEIVAGLLRPDEGRIVIDGVAMLETRRAVCLPAHRRRVGFVFQELRLFPHRSVAGNLRYGMRRADDGAGAPRGPGFDEVVDLLELKGLLRRTPRELSGGERQRVALGRALLSAPRILLLDEPLASLDGRLRGQVLGLLQRVRDVVRIPILHVSHDPAELRAIVGDEGEIVTIERGAIVSRATASAPDRHSPRADG